MANNSRGNSISFFFFLSWGSAAREEACLRVRRRTHAADHDVLINRQQNKACRVFCARRGPAGVCLMCALTRLTWQIALEGEAEAGTGLIHVRVCLDADMSSSRCVYVSCVFVHPAGQRKRSGLVIPMQEGRVCFCCFAFRFGADCRILLTDLAGSLKTYIKNKLLRYSGPSSGNASPEEIGIAESERSLKSPLKNKLSAHLLYLFTPPKSTAAASRRRWEWRQTKIANQL